MRVSPMTPPRPRWGRRARRVQDRPTSTSSTPSPSCAGAQRRFDRVALAPRSAPWYTPDGGQSSPWGRAVLPMEMTSVLAHKSGAAWPVRTPSVGVFLDMEIRLLDGPVFVGQRYAVQREIVGLSQSRRTES